MNEKLLHFIWQFRYFNTKELCTVDGEKLQIIHPGNCNQNQGPDFSEAKIKIGSVILVGNIELHVRSSDWLAHRHTKDKNYSNIILHAVWQHDKIINDISGKPFSTLELQPLVSTIMLQKYAQLMQSDSFVACEKYLPVLSQIGWLSWKERLVAERLQKKSVHVSVLLLQSNNHWEEVFWWMLARNFGIKVNADFFEELAKSISTNILAKHKNQINQLEAILFGQANLLNRDFTEDYPKLLQREYHFLSKKYQLKPLRNQPAFLRMRPANFPTIRLAQLAMLINHSSHLFSKIKELKNIAEVKKLLDVTANDYWHYHYLFDETTDYKMKRLGKQMIDNIIINTIVPVLFAYGFYSGEQEWKDKSVAWLSALNAEQNSITKEWKKFNVHNNNAFDSQSLIELKNNYCNYKLCLDCAVGNKLLKQQE